MFRSLFVMALALAAIAGSGHAFGEGGATDPAFRAQWGDLFQRRPFPYLLPPPESIGLRGANIGQMPWQACRPPNTEAAVTGHWPEPEGCE